METADVYRELADNITKWARSRADVRAVATIGSRATQDQGTDHWSDLDLVVVCKRPRRFVDRSDWLTEIEAPWITYVLQTPAVGERLGRGAVFRDGRATVDFAFIAPGLLWVAARLLLLFSRRPRAARFIPAPFAVQIAVFGRMLRKGADVLLDKDGTMTRLAQRPIQWPVASHPSEQEFTDAVGGFFGYVLWTAKKLCRGDLWRCAVAAQADMKGLLLQMIEWHAHALNGLDYETWYLGRYLDQWADRRVVSALPSLFPHYERSEMRTGLVAMMGLYGWLGKETATRLGYAYPADMEERVVLEVENLLP